MVSGLVIESATIETTVVLLCTTAVVCTVYWLLGFNSSRLPPGPFGLPIVGYIPFITRKPYVKLQELKTKYGPVFSISLGSRYVVVLCDFNVIREAYSKDAFMGRPTDDFFEFNKVTIETEAIHGIRWKEQRRFSLHMLRDLGFGKTRLEEDIREEICDLLERFEKESGKPVDAKKMLAPSTSNNIYSVVFGKRLKYDDPKRIMLDGLLNDVGTLVSKVAWHSLFPWLKKVFVFFRAGAYKELIKVFAAFEKFLTDEIEEHERTLDANCIRDFMDGYLVEIEKHKNDPNTTFQKPVMKDLVGNFFGAGSETVKTTVDWLLLTMSSLEEVQKKVHEEIDDALGRERFPTRADYKRMPYTEAVIMEIMRWRTTSPFGIMRYTLADTQLNSYDIPKHTHIIANLWAVHHDPDLWGQDVEDFKPERFLSEDGKQVRKPEYFIPFSIGKRACPGEALAVVEVFLYFVAILQKFRVRLPAGEKSNFDGQLGIVLQAKTYELIFELRK